MPEDTGIAQLLAERRAAREAEVAARAAAPPKSAKDYFASGLTPNDMNELQLFNQKPLSKKDYYAAMVASPSPFDEGVSIEDLPEYMAAMTAAGKAPPDWMIKAAAGELQPMADPYTLDNAWQRYKDMVHNSRMAVQDYAKRFVAAPVDTVKQTAVDAATGVYDTVTYPGRLLQGDIPFVIDPVTGRVAPEGQNEAVVNALGLMGGAGSIASPPGGLASFFGRGSSYPDELDKLFVENQKLLKKTISDPNSSQPEIDQAMRALMEKGLYQKGGRIAFDTADQYPAMASDDLYKNFGVARLLDGTLLGEISDKGAGWKPDFLKKLVGDNSSFYQVLIPDYATAAVQQLNDIYVRDGNLDSVRFLSKDSKPKSDITQTYNLSDEEFLRKVRVDPLLLVGTRVELDKPDILKRLGGYGHEDVQDIMDISPDELPQALQEKYALGELSPIDGTVITKAEYDRAVEDYVVSNYKKSYNANPRYYDNYTTELARIRDDPGAYLETWGKPSDVLKFLGGTGKEHINDSNYRRSNDIVAVLDNSKEAKLREEFLEKGMPDKKLEDIYDHPELFKAYPQLKDVKVFIEGTKSKLPSAPKGDYGGYWDVVNNRIVFANAKSAKDFFSSEHASGTMIHELDHAISDLEGRAGIYKPQGAAPESFDMPQDRKDSIAQMITNTQAEIEKLQLLKSPSGKDLQDIAWYKDKKKEYEGTLARAEKEGDVGYYSTLGEFTARLAELRKNMSAKELANNPPPIIPFGRLVKPEAVSSVPSPNLSPFAYQFEPNINSPPSEFKSDADYTKSLILDQK
jgi:hypothetical protein